MTFLRSGAGLIPEFSSPEEAGGTVDVVTEEAAIQSPPGPALHVTPLVKEGEEVARGGAVACLRHAPDLCFVSPIAGRVARVSMMPGNRLSEIVVFRDADLGVARHDLGSSTSADGLRRLMQVSGIWPRLQRRPFGGMPAAGETPAAIFVGAADTRPYAPDPVLALETRSGALSRGLSALCRLTEGPVIICWPRKRPRIDLGALGPQIRWISCGNRHPQGSTGIRVHHAFPAAMEVPVWDIHAEDVADLGDLLETGALPMVRLVRISGAGLREGRSVRTHPGADLRQLTQRIVAPGPHVLVSGSQLDGKASRWLGLRHRQITVLPREEPRRRQHWLIAALTESAVLKPAIPSAALSQSLGEVLPAAPFIRALGAGDDETATSLGVLSLLEEDLALTDYVLGAGGQVTRQLRAMLDRIRSENAA